MYGLLFEAAWYVIKSFAEDPKWLGARSAATMVLHTWSQKLTLHPHLHCIVPNGGLTSQGQWEGPKRGNAKFLYPILAMNKVYKAYFLKRLRTHLEGGELSLPHNFPFGTDYIQWKEGLYKKNWVVYAKPPFGGAQYVVKYLARYSHRVAITNRRLTSISDSHVAFRYKDYSDGARLKVTRISGQDFLNRFCLHIMPSRFREIRHYGFLSNASKTKSLQLDRKALGVYHIALMDKKERKELALKRLFGDKAKLCPICKKGQLITRDTFPPNKSPPYA
jgi:hypothetical protein